MTIASQTERVVIFGGTSGIGLATAKFVAQEEAQVVIVGRRHVDDALAQLPDSTEGYVVDVRDEHAIREFFDGLGAFDHLVYTAGETLTLGTIDEMDLNSARQALEDERQELYDGVGASLLVGRVGDPDEIAEAFAFLMHNGYSSGTVLAVDGGAVLV
jgi:NAD(P)-dependent dehydrogenase (short-subunit alcohol dehydrogenase family)